MAGRAPSPHPRREPVNLDDHCRQIDRPETQERHAGGRHRRYEIRVDIERDVGRGVDRIDAGYLRQPGHAGVGPAFAPVGRHHARMAALPERDERAAVIEETVDRFPVDRIQVIDLEKGVEQNLYVAIEGERLLVDQAQLFGPELQEVIPRRPQAFGERPGLGVEIDEIPAAQRFASAPRSGSGRIRRDRRNRGGRARRPDDLPCRRSSRGTCTKKARLTLPCGSMSTGAPRWRQVL